MRQIKNRLKRNNTCSSEPLCPHFSKCFCIENSPINYLRSPDPEPNARRTKINHKQCTDKYWPFLRAGLENNLLNFIKIWWIILTPYVLATKSFTKRTRDELTFVKCDRGENENTINQWPQTEGYGIKY